MYEGKILKSWTNFEKILLFGSIILVSTIGIIFKAVEYNNDLLVKFYAENGLEISESKKYFGTDVKSFALLDGEKVAGAISFSKYKNKNYIEAVAVDKSYRKKGCGRKLLDKAIEEMGTPVYAISKHDKFYLDYGFQYDDADLIDNECKTCSEYNVTCFPKVMVFTR